MKNLVPKKVFLTKGIGKHKEKLASFEAALRNAEIASYNLVTTSSIFPPGAELIEKKEGVKELLPGQVLFVVMSENATNEPKRVISASVGLAIPRDRSTYGYLSEHHSFGQDEVEAGDYAEFLAAHMLATTLGSTFIPPDTQWKKEKDYYKIKDKILHTTSITQNGVGEKDLWVSVIAAAVFII
jgi:arginine decarboxylase